jgi:hypothetical protein
MHLEKAVVLNDSSGNLLHPNYWRLKIDSIDGYITGALENMCSLKYCYLNCQKQLVMYEFS